MTGWPPSTGHALLQIAELEEQLERLIHMQQLAPVSDPDDYQVCMAWHAFPQVSWSWCDPFQLTLEEAGFSSIEVWKHQCLLPTSTFSFFFSLTPVFASGYPHCRGGPGGWTYTSSGGIAAAPRQQWGGGWLVVDVGSRIQLWMGFWQIQHTTETVDQQWLQSLRMRKKVHTSRCHLLVHFLVIASLSLSLLSMSGAAGAEEAETPATPGAE